MFDPHGRDPFDCFDEWLTAASASEPNDPGAAALASVAADGCPAVRMVLVKGRDDESVHFYTNLGSRKAGELQAAGTAAMCFHWKSLRRQLRLVGAVEAIDAGTADAYFQSRPYPSQIGAWASAQSQPLDDRSTLVARVAEFSQKYPANPPRPPHWGGFRLIPHEIEFWLDGESRLHDRFQFTGSVAAGWTVQRLYP